MFNKNQLVPLKNYINNIDNLFAHVEYDNDQQKHLRDLETLEEHSMLTFNYFVMLVEKKGLKQVFKNLINELDLNDQDKNICYELIANAIYSHDAGKSNPNFQFKLHVDHNQTEYRRTYNGFCEAYPADSNHSLLSAVIFINQYQYINNPILKTFVYSLAYVQSKHHGRLENLQEFQTSFQFINEPNFHIKIKENIIKAIKTLADDSILDEFPENSILTNYKYYSEIEQNIDEDFLDDGIFNILFNNDNNFYLLLKLVYVLMTAADSYATYHYSNKLTHIIDDFGLLNQLEWNHFFVPYKQSNIFKGIQQYKNDNNYFGKNNINSLRSDIFLEAEDNLKKFLQSNNNIFYLEAPTGSGKTNTSINLIRTIVENNSNINKAFYIFPFNTLVEQTYSVLVNDFNLDKNKIKVVNSITPISIEHTEDYESLNTNSITNYDLSLLVHQFINCPLVLTSHVNFFSYLFGNGRVESFPFLQLANSVVVLDEIQTYNITLWKEMIYLFNKYAKILNIKFIIMSATLPKLSNLINEPVVNLIYDTTIYYQNPLFKNRVNLDFSMLDNEYQFKDDEDIKVLGQDIVNIIRQYLGNNPKKFLIEMITKKSCRRLFKFMNYTFQSNNFNIYEISGMDNKFKRKVLLNNIKNEDNKNVIVICTQVIEAGVDIDMDIGFKNVSMLENEEQFLGRINRSCKKSNSVAYFFNYYPARRIYKGDYRVKDTTKTINDVTYQNYLLNKDFTYHYNYVFDTIENNSQIYDNTGNQKFDNFKNMINKCNFVGMKYYMQLISSQSYELFLPIQFNLADINLTTKSTLFVNYKNLCEKFNDNFQVTSNVMDGYYVWKAYTACIFDKTLKFAEKQVLLSQFHELIINFTLSVNIDPSKTFKYKIGNLYYVKKSEIQYFMDDDDNSLIDPIKVADYIKQNTVEDELETAQDLFL